MRELIALFVMCVYTGISMGLEVWSLAALKMSLCMLQACCPQACFNACCLDVM